ncbi:hypothetical protein K7X08_019559 [Anisodus acutangulus]|uniref:Uncharacterized protein n=1 Tax=Anisodus acutangulus TaxID=402998 RepID=A0A9Q1MV60_9SOLA|nr:hypothetical protein K7X08_019559 [Anisodus acutangulus]
MLVASYVHHLKISGDFESAEIRLGDLSSLVHVDHTFYCDEDDIIDETIVKDLLVSVRCAYELVVTSLFIKVLTMVGHFRTSELGGKKLYPGFQIQNHSSLSPTNYNALIYVRRLVIYVSVKNSASLFLPDICLLKGEMPL